MFTEFAQLLIQYVKGEPGSLSKIAAHVLAPLAVLLIAISNYTGDPLSISASQPLSITKLKTEFLADGRSKEIHGVAMTLDSAQTEVRIPLRTPPSKLWLSLDQSEVMANDERWSFDQSGLHIRPPFLGVREPVTVILDAQAEDSIQVLGGTKLITEFSAQSQRAASFLSCALLACAFAFGLSIATGFVPTGSNKQAAGKKAT